MPCSCIATANCLNFFNFSPCLSRWHLRLYPVIRRMWSFLVDHFAMFVFDIAQGDVMILMLDGCNIDSSGLVACVDSDISQWFV